MALSTQELLMELIHKPETEGFPHPLLKQQGTACVYASLLKISRSAVNKALVRLLAKDLVYIHSWTDGPNKTPIYARGKGVSAEKPPAMTRAEKLAKERDRRRLTRHGDVERTPTRALAMVNEFIASVKQTPQCWFSPIDYLGVGREAG